MSVSWALWDLETGNAIGDYETESEALALVRELVGKGWPVNALVLIFDDTAIANEDVPRGVSGDELARRAGLASADRSQPIA